MAISSYTIAAVLMLALAVAGVAEEQTPDCASKLLPCAEYLNSTEPSKKCCESIETVVTTQLTCLCGLIEHPSALAGINLTQALELPKHCNLPSDTSVCKTLAPAPGSSSSLPPPATPGNSGNVGGTISWMGMSALLLASTFSLLH